MRKILLTQGKFALVDDEDYTRLSRYKWYAYACRRDHWYVARKVKKQDGRQTTQLVHRLILNVPIGMQTDHINGDGLDNRKANLRVCDKMKNAWNQKLSDRNSTGYKGVYLRKDRSIKSWRACIRVNWQGIALGYYRTPKAAAEAYDAAALKYHRDFARTNEMLGLL